MLTVRVDEETGRQLADILAHEEDTKRSELIKRFIHHLPQPKGFLFPGRHGERHMHSDFASWILREACRRVGIEGTSTHSFRRMALSQISNAAIPLRTIQKISGHRTLAALERYLGVTDQQKQNAISTLNF